MITLTWGQAAAWRLAQHSLLTRAEPADLHTVVTQISGLHAQVLSSAELGAWARIDGLAPGVIADALWTQRTLVKTWAMRGTLHLITAEELPLLAAALSTRENWQSAAWLKYFELTRDEMEAVITGIRAVLDGQCLTREELAAAVAEQTGKPHLRTRMLSGWGSMLKPAAFHGYLCFGPNRGQSVTFVRPDQWIGGWQEFDPQEALLEVARRFLRTFGPASRDDFARWWGVPPTHARPLFTRLASELEEVVIAGQKAWAMPDTVAAIAALPEARVVRLLPGFDPYVVGVGEVHRRFVVPEPFRAKISRTAGWISPVVLVDGRTVGVWQHEKRREQVVVRVEPFTPFMPEIEQGVLAEAQRLGAFLGVPVEVVYGTVFPNAGVAANDARDATAEAGA